MINQFSRTEIILGKQAVEILKDSCVAVFGIGGVGSFAAEALTRSGIGKIILIDNDTISLTNLNRQLIATHKTIGLKKVDVMKNRIFDINPNIKIEIFDEFILYDNVSKVINNDINYVVDAVDTVTAKIAIILESQKLNIPVISCMGTGNKIQPELLEINDIYKTSVCPLAKVMRYELKKRNIKSLKVCFSKELPLVPDTTEETSSKRIIPGSVSFVPSVAGLIIAGQVIKDLINKHN